MALGLSAGIGSDSSGAELLLRLSYEF